MTKTIGYITGTFDLTHSDHFRLLQACKDRCDYLVVGLVTDALGLKQKRAPLLSYEHRRTILENCKHVDLVVAHNGEPKAEAWKKLKFTHLFSSDEYLLSEEHKQFEVACPDVVCVYTPKNTTVSTTQLIEDIEKLHFFKTSIVCMGVSGPIFKYGTDVVVKQINFSLEEMKANNTSDPLGFMRFNGKLPRNWKGNTDSKAYEFPMIAGINMVREVFISHFYRNEKWSPYLSHRTMYEDPSPPALPPLIEYASIEEFADAVSDKRRFPPLVVYMTMKNAGFTLKDVLLRSKPDEAVYKVLIAQVKDICKKLKSDGVVHGDIHPCNLLVDPKTAIVSLIDWGWVMATIFINTKQELALVNDMLTNDFDWTHFLHSIQNSDLPEMFVKMATEVE